MSKLTLFSVPKAFEGHIGVIQSNAIKSWQQLSDDIEVLLIGDDPGVKDFARQNDVPHVGHVERNEFGTPLLSHVFEIAHAKSCTDYLMFVNCDIILTSDLLVFVNLLSEIEVQEFLAIGMRMDFDQHDEIEFHSDWERDLAEKARREGEYASILCKDYFIFSKHQFRTIPPFSIGRGNWDSWMVSTAARQKLPIIDATHHVFAGHQNHGYGHVGGRMKAYVSGAEAKGNIGLAKGRHYFRGSLATHRISNDGEMVRINRLPILNFVRDTPRLLKQLVSFVTPSSGRSDKG